MTWGPVALFLSSELALVFPIWNFRSIKLTSGQLYIQWSEKLSVMS